MEVELRPGAVFAGHRIERVIGRGGMSVVYLAEHLQLGRKVALKILFPHLAPDPGFRDRFVRESQIAAGLDHANIVTVFDAGEVDGLLYLSMRYIDGSDLSAVLGSGAIDPWRAVAIVSMTGGALDAAHEEGLVHRDVKPGNILLSRPGSPLERAFLADFGITKRMSAAEGPLTRTGQFLGTVDYVAPEQIEGQVVDGRTDVYSLGCVLFHCLSGRAPFPRPSDVATIYAHLNDPVPVLPADAPAGMDEVIEKALAKTKEDRYASCAALAEAARSHLDEQIGTTAIMPPTATADVAPSVRRRAWAAVAIVGVLAVVIAGAAAAAIALRDPGPAPPSQGAPPSTSPADVPRADDIVWTTFDWNGGSPPAEGQEVMAHATVTDRGTIVAAGHMDDPDERAVAWTRRKQTDWARSVLPDDHGVTGSRVTGITSLGHRVIVVGYGPGRAMAWYSPDDGQSWQVAKVDGQEGTAMDAVVVAPDDSLIALGHEGPSSEGRGTMWTSADGTSWAQASEGAFDGLTIGYAIAASGVGDTAVAVGKGLGPDGSFDAAVWELRDETWSRVDEGTFSAPGEQDLLAVTGLGDQIVAVGVDYGTDQPVVWTRDPSGTWIEGQIADAGTAASISTVIPIGDSLLLAAGSSMEDGDTDAAIWRSADGVTWERLKNPTKISDLGGDGFQSIRTMLLHPSGKVFAFGDSSSSIQDERFAQAQLWQGQFVR